MKKLLTLLAVFFTSAPALATQAPYVPTEWYESSEKTYYSEQLSDGMTEEFRTPCFREEADYAELCKVVVYREYNPTGGYEYPLKAIEIYSDMYKMKVVRWIGEEYGNQTWDSINNRYYTWTPDYLGFPTGTGEMIPQKWSSFSPKFWIYGLPMD